MMFNTNIPEKFEWALHKVDSMGLIKKIDGYYSYNLSKYNYFMGVSKDGIVAITNDEKFVSEDLNDPKKREIPEGNIGLLNKYNSSMYLNFEELFKMVELPKFIKPYAGSVTEQFVDIKSWSEYNPLNNFMTTNSKLSFANGNENSFMNLMRIYNDIYLNATKGQKF